MTREQEWRLLADIAMRNAERAPSDVERTAWRKIEAGWRMLLESVKPRPQYRQQPQQKLDD